MQEKQTRPRKVELRNLTEDQFMDILKKVCLPLEKSTTKRYSARSAKRIAQKKIDQEVGDGVG